MCAAEKTHEKLKRYVFFLFLLEKHQSLVRDGSKTAIGPDLSSYATTKQNPGLLLECFILGQAGVAVAAH